MQRTVGGLMALALMAVALPAWASTGMAGLDAAFTVVDQAIGESGRIGLYAGIAAFIISLIAGHFYLGFGMFICMVLAGALIGHRAQLGDTVGLTQGAELTMERQAPLVPPNPLEGLLR